MKMMLTQLAANGQVSDYKINIHQKESCELFFVKGKLETVRRSDTCDREVTVYVPHGDYLGESKFLLYASTTEDMARKLADQAVEKALLIQNKPYKLPEGETGSYEVESNFAQKTMMELAETIAKCVFDANTLENAALNSVEVFVYKHTETVLNSNGLNKTQVRYDAMVETIPTYNGSQQSVELYHQYNFSSLDESEIRSEIVRKMHEVKGRYEAVAPEKIESCKVVLGALELSELFQEIASNLNYASVYSHTNFFHKDTPVQKDPTGDVIGITMAGQMPGCIRSRHFDADGMSLKKTRIVEKGNAVSYYGANRYAQYLGEEPTGDLRCVCVDCGSVSQTELSNWNYLEIVSMSGLQVDFFNDYIGGEVRLAYWHKDGTVTPVTGISISGNLSQVLPTIRLSENSKVFGGYIGPELAVLESMKIF